MIADKRIRLMCRHAQQAFEKKPAASKWALEIFKSFTSIGAVIERGNAYDPAEETQVAASGDDEEDGEETPASVKIELEGEDEVPAKQPQQWIVGWDDVQEIAWRHPPGREKEKDFTENVAAQDDGFSPVIATWPDGFSHRIEDVLSGSWAERKESTASVKKATPEKHFEGRMAGGEPVLVVDRPEKLLETGEKRMVPRVFVSGKQKGQVIPTETFGIDVARAVMVQVAQELCDSKLTLEPGEVTKRKLEILRARGAVAEPTPAKKAKPNAGPKKARGSIGTRRGSEAAAPPPAGGSSASLGFLSPIPDSFFGLPDDVD